MGDVKGEKKTISLIYHMVLTVTYFKVTATDTTVWHFIIQCAFLIL